MRALTLIADGSEEIEAVTVVDILRRAKVSVTVASVTGIQVTLSRQVRLLADVCLPDLSDILSNYDAIILPGGLKGAQTFASSSCLQKLLREFEDAGKLVAAMCASTTALHAAGVGKGKKATSYPAFKDQLNDFYDYQEQPVVVDKRLITSRGPGTAMAWSLAIVQELCGVGKAKEVADQLLLMFSFPFN